MQLLTATLFHCCSTALADAGAGSLKTKVEDAWTPKNAYMTTGPGADSTLYDAMKSAAVALQPTVVATKTLVSRFTAMRPCRRGRFLQVLHL